ncbi:MAG: hypothetical protein M5U14_11670 [Acidimicrobiia bacterium]|nr:hypothetical protein [Acidimicrobiia bacterium]
MIAGEGSYHTVATSSRFRDGSPRRRFVFQLAMAERDRPLLEALRGVLGFGSIHVQRPRRPHHQPVAVLTIASRRAHHAATIPFSERFLLPCAKRRQFERWRDALLAYERDLVARGLRGRSRCSAPGCDRPVRGRGLCRRHYYRATGY